MYRKKQHSLNNIEDFELLPGTKLSSKVEPPFEASVMVHFRQRINVEMVNRINEEMIKRGREKTEKKEEKSGSDSEEIGERENKEKLILDATCAPGDIKYPTDLEILNQGRKGTEQIIDSLYKSIKGRLLKLPITYRNIARIEYLKIAKKRHSTKKEGSTELTV